MKTLFIGVLLALSAYFSPAGAATHYLSDCISGISDIACVPGNDANWPCTDPATPCRTTGILQSNFPTLPNGTIIRFAQWGAWDNARLAIRIPASTRQNPTIFESYRPSTYLGLAKPILIECREFENMFGFDVAGADAGYIVRNLELRGKRSGCATHGMWGVFTSQNVSDVTLDNLTISGFAIGFHCGEGLRRMKLLNSYIFDNPDQGELNNCTDVETRDNIFENNGTDTCAGWDNPEDCFLLHNGYYAGPVACGGNVLIEGNTYLRNSQFPGFGLNRSPVLVVHGCYKSITVKRNLVLESPATMKGGGYGIIVDGGYGAEWGTEGFTDLEISGNTVVDVGAVAIGCTNCPKARINNNTAILTGPPTGIAEMNAWYGFSVTNREYTAGDLVDTGSIMTNNTCYVAYMPAGSSCYTFGEYGPTSTGTGVVFASNAAIFVNTDNINATAACYTWNDVAQSAFAQFDYNVCWRNGRGRVSEAYASQAAMAAAGWNVNGSEADAKLTTLPTNANRYLVCSNDPTSSLRDASSPTYHTPADIRGKPAMGDRDTGSCEGG